MSSAANMQPPGTEAEANSTAVRPNPVALEALVSVTGAKAGATKGARDLFSEDTSTVVVFKDGAVIRLTAAVSAGQLLFLTNKKTKQEVICQVLHTRGTVAQTRYVELRFTEERLNYWGALFPDDTQDPSNGTKPEKQINAGPVVPAHQGPPAVWRSAEDPAKFKAEVGAIRQELFGADKDAAATPAKPSPQEPMGAAPAPVTDSAKRMTAMPATTQSAKEELAHVNDPSPSPAGSETQIPPILMPPAQPKNESRRPVVGMTLPIQKQENQNLVEEQPDPSEDLLPQPELDFSQIPTQATREHLCVSAQINGVPHLSKARILVLSGALLVALLGAAWYGKWWQHMPFIAPSRTPALSNVGRPSTRNTTPAPIPSKPASNSNTAPANRELPKVATEPLTGDKAPAVAETQPAPSRKDERFPATKKPLSSANQTPDQSGAAETPQAPIASDTTASDASLTPAKLLKAANPVYPPSAMLNYITGDVKAEVIIDGSGHVTDVRVISGPQALRDAAVDALKQYQYAAATQAGKPVPSKTTAIVKFWFNP
ncbi:MAG: energy transducer TonB [Candidatus Acidiferrum sp.]